MSSGPAYSGADAGAPRSNGELVFGAPWERRAFGVALALHESGTMDWEAFQRELVTAIAAWQQAHPGGGDYPYYECWLAALENVVVDAGVVDGPSLQSAANVMGRRPAGHDHHGGHAGAGVGP